jgi:hypothetical protein
MIAKEKAEWLVKKMYAVHSNSASDITLHFAKECALIAVDEIMKAPFENSYIDLVSDEAEDTTWFWDKFTEFWTEVKQEIQKL